MSYRELMPRVTAKPTFEIDSKKPLHMLADLLRFHLNISTWLALGASIQAFLAIIPLPRRYTLAPGVFFLLYRVVKTVLISYKILPNPQLNGSITHKYSALVLDQYGNFPAEAEIPTKEKVAVLLLTAKINHPGGWFFSPLVDEFRVFFKKMNDELQQQPQSQTGFLGHSQAFMPDKNGSVAILNFSYWRSKDDILRYADSPTHREAINWWSDVGGNDGKGGKVPHIAISHEIYESGPGQWESLYVNYQPSMLGATTYLKPGSTDEKGLVIEDEWISPVIDARRGQASSSRRRMGMARRYTAE